MVVNIPLLLLVLVFVYCDVCDREDTLCVGDFEEIKELQDAIDQVLIDSPVQTIYLKNNLVLTQTTRLLTIGVTNQKEGNVGSPIVITPHPRVREDIVIEYKQEDMNDYILTVQIKYWAIKGNENSKIRFEIHGLPMIGHEKDSVIFIKEASQGKFTVEQTIFLMNTNRVGEGNYISGIRIHCENKCDDTNFDEIIIRDSHFEYVIEMPLGQLFDPNKSKARGIKISIKSSSSQTIKVIVDSCTFFRVGTGIRLPSSFLTGLGHGCGNCFFTGNSFTEARRGIFASLSDQEFLGISITHNNFVNCTNAIRYKNKVRNTNTEEGYNRFDNLLIERNTFQNSDEQDVLLQCFYGNLSIQFNNFFASIDFVSIDISNDCPNAYAKYNNAIINGNYFTNVDLALSIIRPRNFQGYFSFSNNIIRKIQDDTYGWPSAIISFRVNSTNMIHTQKHMIDFHAFHNLIICYMENLSESDIFFNVQLLTEQVVFNTLKIHGNLFQDCHCIENPILRIYSNLPEDLLVNICNGNHSCEITSNIFSKNKPLDLGYYTSQDKVYNHPYEHQWLIQENEIDSNAFKFTYQETTEWERPNWYHHYLSGHNYQIYRAKGLPLLDYNGFPRRISSLGKVTVGPIDYYPCGPGGEYPNLENLNDCFCRNSWSGPRCEECPINKNIEQDCKGCAPGYMGNPVCFKEIDFGIGLGFIVVGVGLFIICIICVICMVIVGIICCVVRKRRKNGGGGVKRKDKKKLKKSSSRRSRIEELEDEETSEAMAKLNINEELFKIEYDSLEIMRKIGKGGSNSIIFECAWNGVAAAFKCFKISDFLTGDEEDERFREFEREVEILASVNHPYVLQFFGATLSPPRVGIVMELCDKGDLKKFLTKYHKENNKFYDRKEKLRILFEIASAMTHLHLKKIIHRDLKCENVLLNSSYTSKVMDFGLSKIVSFSAAKTKRVGTSVYMSPEIARGDEYSEKTDVFSFSIMIFEIIENNFDPYGLGKSSNFNLEMKVSSNPDYRPQKTELKQWIGIDWLSDLMKQCWSDDITQRLSMKQIMNVIKEKK